MKKAAIACAIAQHCSSPTPDKPGALHHKGSFYGDKSLSSRTETVIKARHPQKTPFNAHFVNLAFQLFMKLFQ